MRITTGTETRAIADNASEAIRALIRATHPAGGLAGLEYPADVYHVLGALSELASRLPQLFQQLSVFLQQRLQHDTIDIDGGEFVGDPFGAVGTATHALEGDAIANARRLADALDVAHQATAFASRK